MTKEKLHDCPGCGIPGIEGRMTRLCDRCRAERRSSAALVWHSRNRAHLTEYQAAWVKNNPEKVAAINAARRKDVNALHDCPGCGASGIAGRNGKICEKCRGARAVAASAAWVKANPERVVERARVYRMANLEREAVTGRAWREANRESTRTRTRAWRLANPERVAAGGHNRRVLKRGVNASLTADEWEGIVARFAGRCAYCQTDTNVTGIHMDHMVPISKGGHHEASNVVPSCPSCNLSKGASNMAEWYLDKFPQAAGVT